MTHRQFTRWQQYLVRRWNKPSRTDYYLMQLNCTVKQLLAKNPRRIKIQDQKLKFNQGGEQLTREQATNKSKSNWLGMFAKAGMTIRVMDNEGNLITELGRQNISDPPNNTNKDRTNRHTQKTTDFPQGDRSVSSDIPRTMFS